MGAVLLLFLIWPSSFYFLVIQIAPAGTGHPYHAARKIGEKGSIFFIKLGLNSSNPNTRSLMVSPAIRHYLEQYGGTPEIWEVITMLLTSTEWEQGLFSSKRDYLEEYVYGKNTPISGEKRNKRILYFSVEEVQWANEHIFKRPRNYRIPEELLLNSTGE